MAHNDQTAPDRGVDPAAHLSDHESFAPVRDHARRLMLAGLKAERRWDAAVNVGGA